MGGYDTNLAAEFFAMSSLHRMGLAANLTLGNKKGVDIVVARAAGDAVTVEVKGVSGKYDWPANNIHSASPDRHFVVLVSFEGRISDPGHSARVWVVPYPDLEPFLRQYSGRRNVSRAAIIGSGDKFENAWELIEKAPTPKAAQTTNRSKPRTAAVKRVMRAARG